MTILKAVFGMGLLSCLLIGHSGCKKGPATATFEVDEPTIVLICNPISAAGDAVVSASVFIKGNRKEIRVFGLELTFDSRMFQFQEVHKGTLTEGWAAVDGNEVGTGSLRVGGFLGGGTAIPLASQGSLAEIRFRVTGTDYGNGQQSQFCVKQYTDDLLDFKPDSACATFTLIK
jgi:hypothetical protein